MLNLELNTELRASTAEEKYKCEKKRRLNAESKAKDAESKAKDAESKARDAEIKGRDVVELLQKQDRIMSDVADITEQLDQVSMSGWLNF